jgi:hypothetical protein
MNLVDEIRKALDAVPLPANCRFAQWTGDIQAAVANLAAPYAAWKAIGLGSATNASQGGKRLVVHAAGRKLPAHAPQFIYDQSWLVVYDNAELTDGYLSECVLAMESELTAGSVGIFEDFLKLVIGCADNKVMIFAVPKKAELYDLVREFETQISLFERDGHRSQYLISGIHYEDQNSQGSCQFHHFSGGVELPLRPIP